MVAVLLAAALVAGGLLWRGVGNVELEELPIPGGEDRITVEVLNASGIDGLARSITGHLRRHGLDVVSWGSAPRGTDLDSTRILVRRGDIAAGMAVRTALGVGQVAVEPAPRLLLDVSVFLGRDAGGLKRHP